MSEIPSPNSVFCSKKILFFFSLSPFLLLKITRSSILRAQCWLGISQTESSVAHVADVAKPSEVGSFLLAAILKQEGSERPGDRTGRKEVGYLIRAWHR